MNLDIEKIVREYITKTKHLSLATAAENKPWVCEVHFAYDDNLNLYFRSKTSTRHCQEIEKNPFVAGDIVKQHTLDEYPHAIYFEGMAEQIVDKTQKLKIFEYFKTNLRSDETIIEDAEQADGHKFYKITVRNWYVFGKFGSDKGQKLTLKWNEVKV